MSPEVVFTLLYLLLSACIVYPPTEFVTAGITIPIFFSSLLGSEHEKFITYHIKKSILNLLVYSLLPLGYVVLLFLLGYVQELTLLFAGNTLFWKLFATTSIILPLLALCQIKIWTDNNYGQHPITLNLAKFCNNNMNWKSVANDIEIEFRRIDKICIETNTITKIIATENWLLKVTPLTIFTVHQSDASLIVKKAESYNLSHITSSETQYLNIEVKSGRRNVNPFIIRINAMDFKDLQDRVTRSIVVSPNVKFHKSILEQFIDVFKDTIKNNEKYTTNQELDQCIGCLQTRPSIKIQKLCEDTDPANVCTSCFCRPMWCTDCIAKWFASRQDIEQRNQWLSSKCTCPMCRATFCVLDVCLLNEVEE